MPREKIRTTEKDIIKAFHSMENFRANLILCGMVRFLEDKGLRRESEDYVVEFMKGLNGASFDEILKLMEETFDEESRNTIVA